MLLFRPADRRKRSLLALCSLCRVTSRYDPQVQKDLQRYVDVWGAAAEFAEHRPVWVDGSFIKLDPEEVRSMRTRRTSTGGCNRIGR